MRGQNCYKGVMGGKELELSPLSEGICQQSLVQIKPWLTHQKNRWCRDFLKFASHHFLLYAVYI